MSPKYKALLYNFIGFAFLFVVLRLLLGYFFTWNTLVLALLAAIGANILVPKFAIVKKDGKEQVVMKWISIKGLREM